VVVVRVLSPSYGNTIFTFSSVISVIVLPLTFGYHAGGKLADHHPTCHGFSRFILASGVILVLSYFLRTICCSTPRFLSAHWYQ
jgi:hypothetical protein